MFLIRTISCLSNIGGNEIELRIRKLHIKSLGNVIYLSVNVLIQFKKKSEQNISSGNVKLISAGRETENTDKKKKITKS